MEITLFDKSGRPRAYITDDNEKSIYIWKGKAVAYIVDDLIYGWKGKHLGWFVDGIIYNLKGYRVGFIRETCPVSPHSEPSKYSKQSKYSKYSRHSPHSRVSFKQSNSSDDLEEFLTSNAPGT